MQQAGNVQKFANTEELSTLLECPCCTDIPFPPIYQCVQGHNICKVCRPRLKKCPTCCSNFSPKSRNYTVESIVLSASFQCTYRDNGCGDLIKGARFEEHLKTCLYRNGKVKEKEGPTAGTSQRTGCSNANEGNARARRIGGCCQWISSSTANYQIPDDAVDGGIEHGARLYVGRAKHEGGLFPGKIHSTAKALLFPLAGGERVKNEYEVLVAIPGSLRWEDALADGTLPSNAIIGGRTDVGEALYIGRCGHGGTLAVGWILPCAKELRIAYQGKEFKYTRYEALVKTNLGIAIDNNS